MVVVKQEPAELIMRILLQPPPLVVAVEQEPAELIMRILLQPPPLVVAVEQLARSNSIDKHIGSGKVPYDVNLRTVVAFREIGRGHTAIETIGGFMNMPPPMTSKTY